VEDDEGELTDALGRVKGLAGEVAKDLVRKVEQVVQVLEEVRRGIVRHLVAQGRRRVWRRR
jgi:hypothetical protein